jgi:AGZA family xanthine/uracil permease-like MFS transporter
MNALLERFFGLAAHKTTPAREIAAGTTTFLTMSYIIFVQPAVLSAAGMPFEAVMAATCLAAAFGSAVMAFLANYPIALAPAMGHNFFFAFTVCGAAATGGMGLTWREGLAAVFVSGGLFLFLSLFGFRGKIVHAVPGALRHAIAVGIGLLIALLGLQWGGIVVDTPGTLVGLGDLTSGPTVVTLFGLLLIAGLTVRRFRGAILIGVLSTTGLAVATGYAPFHGVVASPPSLTPTLFELDFAGLFGHPDFWVAVVIFFFLDLFDTIGTLLGVATAAGMLDENGRLPKAERALAADAAATVAGAAMGTSTVTSYIESSAGVAAGGRTGLTALTVGGWFLAALFFTPLVKTVGAGYATADGATLYPAIAPALIVVGAMMFALVRHIPWDAPTEAIPAYLTVVTIPLSFSITEGIAIGFISYSLLAIIDGRGKETGGLVHLIAVAFLLRYLFL